MIAKKDRTRCHTGVVGYIYIYVRETKQQVCVQGVERHQLCIIVERLGNHFRKRERGATTVFSYTTWKMSTAVWCILPDQINVGSAIYMKTVIKVTETKTVRHTIPHLA